MEVNRLLKHCFTFFSLLLLLFAFCSEPLLPAETNYTCPMHPHYISEHPGTCPICGMDLIEIEAGQEGTAGQNDQEIVLPNYLIQRTGVRSKPAETAYFGNSIRSFGEVVVNQRLQNDVSLRVEGWIEELKVNAEGDEVAENSLLFRFYSPQLVAAQQDYLTALSSGVKGRITVTEDRLRSLGVQKLVLDEIKNSQKLIRSLPYYNEQKGRVENITIRQGSFLRPGAVAMRIQSYEKVWINVNLAEQDISFVSKNSRVDVDFPNLGIHRENVEIDYIAPTIDPGTRTAQLRLILDNPEGLIRPGAYVDVAIMTDIAPRLTVPYESILMNKEGSYVIVDRGEGTYQAREIKTGIQYKGLVEVQAGLSEGESVVTSGQFLIDSESSLRESFRRMEKMALSLADLELSNEQMILINHMVEGGIYVHEELITQSVPKPQLLDAADLAAKKLEHELQGSRLVYVLEDFRQAIGRRHEIIVKSDWLTLLADTMKALQPWIIEGRPDYYKKLGLTFYITEDHRSWIQFSGEMKNPYADTPGSVKAKEIVLGGQDPSIPVK